MDVLEQARAALERVCNVKELDRHAVVSVKMLTPDEAIGAGASTEFVIKTGKERVIEACFHEAKGQAFTDAPTDWDGTLAELLSLDLTITRNRAVFTAGLNAVLSHLRLVEGAVHCLNDEPTKCGDVLAEKLLQRFGNRAFTLVGLQPAILKSMVALFGPANIGVLDLNPDNIGTERQGVLVMDGNKDLEKLIARCDVGLATGSSVVNGTINDLIGKFREAGKPLVFFGNTVSGVAALTGLERVCPFAH